MILYYLLGWQIIPIYKRKNTSGKTKVTIVIPARNEQDNMHNLLTCLEAQDYDHDLFEVMIVDDHSTDLTPDIVESWGMDNLHLLKLADHVSKEEVAYKKRAVELAVEQGIGDLILTSDADCLMGEKWVSTIVSFYEETDSKFIVAPVAYKPIKSFVDHLEALDFMTVMGVTGATVQHKLFSLSNGANMAYEKKVFKEANGYDGIDHVPSGDDVFLIEKIGRMYPYHVNYLKNKDAIVYTYPCSKLKVLVNQRMRWMSKTPYYSDLRTKLAASLLIIFYATLIANIGLAIWDSMYLNILIVQLLLKILVDFMFAREIAQFFKEKRLLYFFPFLEILHLPFVLVVGIMSQIFKYTWKSRTY